ncbi:MAG: DUF4835 family protein [Bacteroidia bacterium]|nr:DUF4835 family protein [Bacteroidia bacterium]MCX7652397.1 DUF4835 family protein [Bacteroidia bacterium]MDW8417370.1 DUF4835 family protein [Bacteroidia bacterium]
MRAVLTFSLLWAQELLPIVNIQAPGIQGIDRSILQQLQQDITQYLSTNRFSDDVFAPNERIKCLFSIVITALPNPTRFEGTIQVQAIRPVYNSTYETLTFNFNDPDLRINYTATQTLQFSENTYVDNLTALLNFYAYMILGMDYDSFGAESGLPYFQKAQQILNLAAANSNEPGWQPTGNFLRSRYWVMENLLNSSYKAFHTLFYRYHREGLDKMHKDPSAARETLLQVLQDMVRFSQENPNSTLIRLFVDTKGTELMQIFQKSLPEQKQRFVAAMKQLDPNNLSGYENLLQEGGR